MPPDEFRRDNKTPDGNARDIFQELRKKKLLETQAAAAPSANILPENATPRRSSRLGLLVAALLGALVCLVYLKLAGKRFVQEPFSRPTLPAKNLGTHGTATLAALAAKHAAVNWDNAIPANRRANPFSIEIADAFLRDEPVVVRGVLLDVERGQRGLAVRFGLPNSHNQQMPVLWLECYRDQLPMFASATKGRTEFAVVARCYDAQIREEGYFISGQLVDAEELFATGRAAPENKTAPSLMEAAIDRVKNSGN